MLQQALLLFFVEGLDLVEIEQDAVGRHEGVQLGDDVLDVRRGGGGGVELVEGTLGGIGDDVGDGGLSRAAGAVEDQIGDLPRLNHAAEHFALTEDLLLAEHLIQRLWAQLVRKGLIHGAAPPFLCIAGFFRAAVGPKTAAFLFLPSYTEAQEIARGGEKETVCLPHLTVYGRKW